MAIFDHSLGRATLAHPGLPCRPGRWSLRGEKTTPLGARSRARGWVTAVGRDRYGISGQYFGSFCSFLYVGVCAIAPNSDVLDDLRKGCRAGFFAPQGRPLGRLKRLFFGLFAVSQPFKRALFGGLY